MTTCPSMRPMSVIRPILLPLMITLSLLLLAPPSHAGVVVYHYDFDAPSVTQSGEYSRVTMPGALSTGAPGEPALPALGARLLLPPGEAVVSVSVTPGAKVTLDGSFTVIPVQPQYPLSMNAPPAAVGPDDAVYSSGAPYPGALHDDPVYGLFRGYGIAAFGLHPVEYVPAEGKLSYYRSMDVEILTAPAERAEPSLAVRRDRTTLKRLSAMVDNPSLAADYSSVTERRAAGSLDESDDCVYLIITTDAWDEHLVDFADFQTRRGLKAGIFLRSWIVANYDGRDDQECIRNFIIDAYNTWPVEHVLLVGDARDEDGIPHRGLFNSHAEATDYGIPADTYYGSLDGTWDTDSDGWWGESFPEDEADLYPDVAVGRACVSTLDDLNNFVTKTMRHTLEPVVADCEKAIMVGEFLWDGPPTYGGDYMDEIKDGSSANGYTTAGFPLNMTIDTLYDRDGNWSPTTLVAFMETGSGIVSHLGHSNTTYTLKMRVSDIPAFDNDGIEHAYNFVYGQGCYCGAFDNMSTGGAYTSDCFAEEFACDDDGAVAAIMNSRYGWGDVGGTNGSSQYFNREFFDAMFGEGIYGLGDANDDSKADAVWAIDYGLNRWCHYQINLFGDPALQLWTAVPGTLHVSCPDSVVLLQPDISIAVTSGGEPVPDARVTIYTEDYSVYGWALTDAGGEAIVPVGAEAPGSLHVVATAHNHLDGEGSARIVVAEGPYLAYPECVIDDDTDGDSSGNANHRANAGETLELVVTLKNVGTETAAGVTATLSSSSSLVTILDGEEAFDDIPGSSSGACLDDFDVLISPDTPNGEVIPFVVEMSSEDRGSWESTFDVSVASPEVFFAYQDVDDSPAGAYSNGCAEPGETIDISVGLRNVGGVVATGLVATLSTEDPYVAIEQEEASANVVFSDGALRSARSSKKQVATPVFLCPDGSIRLTPEFSVRLLPDCPGDHEIVFDLDIEGDWGYNSSDQFRIMTGGAGFSDDVEGAYDEWAYIPATPGCANDWHIDVYRYHSSAQSWKYGGYLNADYSDASDGVLVTSPRCLGAGAEFSFWHWLRAEEDGGGFAWDGCLVEITTDGGAIWETLYPEGGYTHVISGSPSNGLPPGTPCWSGRIDWTQEVFDLSAYEGETARIRFRFVSDETLGDEGWYVDDISLTQTRGATAVEEPVSPAVRFALEQNVPNPFNPTTAIRYSLASDARVSIAVYNIAGRLVRTLVDEEQAAGAKVAAWDGRNEAGEPVASGVYMYRMEAGDFQSRRMMVLLK